MEGEKWQTIAKVSFLLECSLGKQMIRKTLVLESIFLIIFGFSLYLVFSATDLFEKLHAFTTHYEHFEVDELILLIPVLLLLVVIFSMLRLRDVISLNEELSSKHEQLQQTQAQLIQAAKLASLGEMATGIVHELNQPLTYISLSAKMLSKSLEKNNLREAKESSEQIDEQARKAAQIILHMKTFGRNAGKEGCQANDLNCVLENAVVLIKTQLKGNAVELRMDLQENLPYVDCNAIQIEQVFINLLKNAQDALEGSKGTIAVRSYDKDAWVVVEIEDSGHGMPPELLENIFESFFTTKEKGKGTGLGLSISNHIINAHGGEIKAQSQVGRGTLFRIQLPVVDTLQ